MTAQDRFIGIRTPLAGGSKMAFRSFGPSQAIQTSASAASRFVFSEEIDETFLHSSL